MMNRLKLDNQYNADIDGFESDRVSVEHQIISSSLPSRLQIVADAKSSGSANSVGRVHSTNPTRRS
jgi:hypothetical protein